jgi:hypothetical protein
VEGTVSLLVFFRSAKANPLCCLRARDRAPAGPRSSGVLGFNWGIDPASPQQVHEAQSRHASIARRAWTTTPWPIRSSTTAPSTTFMPKSAWTLLEMPEDDLAHPRCLPRHRIRLKE